MKNILAEELLSLYQFFLKTIDEIKSAKTMREVEESTRLLDGKIFKYTEMQRAMIAETFQGMIETDRIAKANPKIVDVFIRNIDTGHIIAISQELKKSQNNLNKTLKDIRKYSAQLPIKNSKIHQLDLIAEKLNNEIKLIKERLENPTDVKSAEKILNEMVG